MEKKEEITVKRGKEAITLTSLEAKSGDYKEGFQYGVKYILEKLGWKSQPKKVPLTFLKKEDHIRRHNELHKALDELTGNHIRITGKLPGATNILELMEWSNKQRTNPEVSR